MLSWFGLTVLLVERNTSISMSQKSRASNPSMRDPASREMISDSVELCETEVCFVHVQLMVTNFLLQGRQQSSSLGTHPVYNCQQDNLVGIRLGSLLTDHRMSGLPIRAKYKHFRTVCEQTSEKSPTDSSSSSLN